MGCASHRCPYTACYMYSPSICGPRPYHRHRALYARSNSGKTWTPVAWICPFGFVTLRDRYPCAGIDQPNPPISHEHPQIRKVVA